MGGNWVSHCVNKCWLSPSGLGCVSWNSKNSPCFGSNIFGLYGAGSRAAAWSQCGLKSLTVCLLHMWICSTDVSWLPGRQAFLPLAFLARVVTWWHTVASGVQTGSPRANMIQSSTSLALLRPSTTFETDGHEMILGKWWLSYLPYILEVTCREFLTYLKPLNPIRILAIQSSW